MSAKVQPLHPAGYVGEGAGWSCLECSVWVPAMTDGERSPGWAQMLCARCDAEDLERADRQLAERLAEPPPPDIDPDADVRTLAVHLVDVLTTETPPSLWMQWSESDEDLEDLTPHLERKP